MTKLEMKEFDHLCYLKGERKDSIEILKQFNERDEAYFDNKIKHSKGLKKEIWIEVKHDRLTNRKIKIEELEHEVNVINKRLAELKGESK